jgi:hypothetical protein
MSLPVVLMGRDVVSYTIKEKYRFRIFDKNELMNMYLEPRERM